MVCPHCEGADRVFNAAWAQRELNEFRKHGPAKATQTLINVLKEAGVTGLSLLDIGGGIGAIQHTLASAGINRTIDVDASSAYLKIAQAEAQKLGYADKAQYLHGDFVQLAPQIEPADIVTLDRVVCCYPDMHALVKLSSERAKRFYALIYPRDNIFLKYGIHVFNFFSFVIWRSPFRTYIHSSHDVDAVIQDSGLKQLFHKNVGFWQVYVYQR
jgi:hypothetical protein